MYNKKVHIAPNDNSLKVNVITQLEFEHTYFEGAVQYFSLYAKKVQSINFLKLFMHHQSSWLEQ